MRCDLSSVCVCVCVCVYMCDFKDFHKMPHQTKIEENGRVERKRGERRTEKKEIQGDKMRKEERMMGEEEERKRRQQAVSSV